MTTNPWVVLSVTALLFSGCLGPQAAPAWVPHGDELDGVQVSDFTLTTSENTSWTYSEEASNTTLVVAFLFTNCLDVCPVVTHNMKWVQSQLTDEERNKTTFLTVTVDPWRDNVSTLHAWKTGTQSEWAHLTVDDNRSESEAMTAIQNVWLNFGVGLTIEEAGTSSTARHHPDDYTVNHTTGTVLVDRFGTLRVWWGDNDWILDLFLEDLRYLHTL